MKKVNAHHKFAIIQGGLSTLLGVIVLATVDSYMVQVFFQNVLLVILLGVAHALIFMPVVLDTTMPWLDGLFHSHASSARAIAPYASA